MTRQQRDATEAPVITLSTGIRGPPTAQKLARQLFDSRMAGW